MTSVDERRPHFEDHNHFFLALLGLASFGMRLDDVIREHGTPPMSVPIAGADVERDEVLCALLGLVALRRRQSELFESASLNPSTPHQPVLERRNAANSILR
jgi:hypothetical protein